MTSSDSLPQNSQFDAGYHLVGIGNDIVEVGRIRAILERYPSRFPLRVFTPSEQEYCFKKSCPSLHFAARFAAKEAVSKALGTGFSAGLSWLDIEIQNEHSGKPIVVFSPFAREKFGEMICHISMSHCKDYATACAILFRKTDDIAD